MLDAPYDIRDTRGLLSPSLLVFRDLLEANLDRMLQIAGDPQRLRPHCKTHKMPAITAIELQKGITKHKCATLAEAEMLADAGVEDVFLAYNLVGPNIARAVVYRQRYPAVHFSATADAGQPVEALGQAFSDSGVSMQLLLDLDVGMGRTGLPIGAAANDLYARIARTPGVEPGGLHVYDGHLHQRSREARRAAVAAIWERVLPFRDNLVRQGLPVPRIVAGGTGTFPIHADLAEPTLELSPGTTVLHDAGYTDAFPDLHFEIAAALLTRVISRPASDRITLDLGSKACAADPPESHRVVFPGLPEARIVLQNEEHLVLESPHTGQLAPGDALLAFPWHICPTTAVHRQVYVVQGGRVVTTWDVAARDRQITI